MRAALYARKSQENEEAVVVRMLTCGSCVWTSPA